MLSQLTIQNFGLIDRLSIEFLAGLNILTGETGAGKSILIDALRCALGERLDASTIRDPGQPCFIEAIFNISAHKLLHQPPIAEFLNPGDNDLIIQRSYSSDGKNRVKINGLSVTVGQLKEAGNYLVDFHGAHDHQMLLSDDQHLIILDQLVDFKDLKTDYGKIFLAYCETQRQLAKLNLLRQTRERDLDLLKHQVKELEALPLSEEKYAELLQEQTKLINNEKLHEHVSTLLGLLHDDDAGVDTLLRKAFGPLKSLTQIDEKSINMLNQLATIQEQTHGLVGQLTDYADSLQFDPKEAQTIHHKCEAYDDLKRKYGPTLEDAQKFYGESKEKLALILDADHNDHILKELLKQHADLLSKTAIKISKARQKSAADLNATIEAELKELGIHQVKFEARFEQIPFEPSGQDKVVFYISPNAGEDLKPLAKIVSSGEAARVMLALKKALIKVDPVPVLIFDEIDAQIGGRLGNITGRKLKELSKYRQVILITHLPQIASFADRHLKVVKSVKAGRAFTEVAVLAGKKQIEEIAQMMSGQDTSRISISHAQDMLENAAKNS